MIIKSKTRKDASFHQLVQYIMRETREDKARKKEQGEEELFTFLHNFDDGVMPDDMEGISASLFENSKHLKKRKNGVVMYHEIASFAPEDASKIDRSMMEQLSRKYIDVRAKRAMVLARPHFDKEHVHIHFLISGNERGNSRKLRVSKEEFQKQRREVEQYQLEHFPQLSNSYVHTRDKQKYKQKRVERMSDATRAMKERGAKQTIKMGLVEQVSQVMSGAENIKSLVTGLQKKGLEIYDRGGIPYGIMKNGKRYRFGTLLKGTEFEGDIKLMLANEREMERARQRLLRLKKPSVKQERKRRR